LWRERLVNEGLDEPALLALSAATPEELQRALPDPPAWLIELDEAYATSGAAERDPIPYPEWVGEDPTGRFLTLFDPLVRRARTHLARGLQALALPGATAKLERLLLAGLPMGLAAMLERTAVLELHVARHRGLLSGETPEERFDSYVTLLRQPGFAREILLEYCVLGRCAAEFVQTWLETSLELMSRLSADWDTHRASLLGPEPGELTKLELEAGDPHRGGRAVAILGFESGARLVYKPRSLGMEARFQELLSWLNDQGAEPPFRTLRVVERDEYGWVEFAEDAPCAGALEVEHYFHRLGALLAVLHTAGAMDFHFQNLVASGAQPLAVDLESLFHPTLPGVAKQGTADRLAASALGDSLLRVGMLPFHVNEPEAGGAQDWSGVASVAGQITPDPVLDWERAGTDEMRAVKRHVPMRAGRNRPTQDEGEAQAKDHVETILRGFEAAYRFLLEHRDALLAPGGPLERFGDQPSRVVLRTTRGYALVLEESWHPDFLRDALDRDRFLDRLWVGADQMPTWRVVAPYEHRDLWRDDIPWFGARPRSREITTSGGERIPDFVAESGLAWTRRRLREMGEDDLQRQLWLARISLGTLRLDSDSGEWPEYPLEVAPDPVATRQERAMQHALRLGDWFERTAFRDGADCIWTMLDLKEKLWSLFPCSEDLYSGAPGIALFLSCLSAASGEERFAHLARAGMNPVLGQLDATPEQVRFIGLYQGWGSAIYALAHLGVWSHAADAIESAERLIPRILERLERDTVLDVVGGAAGAVTALLALHRAGSSALARSAAIRCGEHLLRAARPLDGGVAWLTELSEDEPATGFAHGASGIATALLELALATGETRFLEAGLTGLAFERRALQGEIRIARSEADTTHRGPERALAFTWCYGAPGMGFARASALRAIDALHAGLEHQAALERDLEETLALTLERGFGKSHCLCHGDLGNLDFLLEVETLKPSSSLRGRIDALTEALLASSRAGWRCGTAARIDTPGLMNGLAGIGYGLLRLAAPERVPSVLAMDPPRAPRAVEVAPA
jgi:type 2 lantibiotic biosynthesis protein LanM